MPGKKRVTPVKRRTAPDPSITTVSSRRGRTCRTRWRGVVCAAPWTPATAKLCSAEGISTAPAGWASADSPAPPPTPSVPTSAASSAPTPTARPRCRPASACRVTAPGAAAGRRWPPGSTMVNAPTGRHDPICPVTRSAPPCSVYRCCNGPSSKPPALCRRRSSPVAGPSKQPPTRGQMSRTRHQKEARTAQSKAWIGTRLA